MSLAFMKNTQFHRTQSYVKTVFSVFLVGSVSLCSLSAQAVAVAPIAQDNASANGLANSKSKSFVNKKNKQASTNVQEDEQAAKAVSKQTICETKKPAIENKVRAFTGAAKLHVQKLDDKLVRLMAIKQKLGLQSAELNSLIDTANVIKRDTVQPAIDQIATTLQSNKLECGATDVAVAVRGYRDQAQTTKDALDDYRQAIKAVALTMKDVAKASVAQ